MSPWIPGMNMTTGDAEARGLIGTPPSPLATSDAPGDAPEEVGIGAELVALEEELAQHEAAALATRRRIASLAPHVDDRFGAMLAQQADIDDWLADPNFDAEAFAKQLRRKTDQMRAMVEDLMPKRAEGLRDAARPIVSKAQAIENNRKRLRDAIVKEMQANHYDRMPGIVWAVRLRDSPPAMQIDRAPTVEDYERFPGYVRRDSVYTWDQERIRDELKAGKAMPFFEERAAGVALNDAAAGELVEIDLLNHPMMKIILPARLTRGQWPEFVPNVPPALEKTKKPRRGKAP